MKYQVSCMKCDCCIFVRGTYEPDTNATVLDDNSPVWDDGCDHIKNGDYEIFAEVDDELPEDYSIDHGDSLWPR